MERAWRGRRADGLKRRGGARAALQDGVAAVHVEGERGRDRARRRRVGKQKFWEGEVEATIYICLIKFEAEAGEAKEEEKKICRSE